MNSIRAQFDVAGLRISKISSVMNKETIGNVKNMLVNCAKKSRNHRLYLYYR